MKSSSWDPYSHFTCSLLASGYSRATTYRHYGRRHQPACRQSTCLWKFLPNAGLPQKVVSALRSIADKQRSSVRSDEAPSLTLPREHRPFFQGFGPDISWALSYLMPSDTTQRVQRPTNTPPAAGAPDVNHASFSGSPSPATVPLADEYRPLTTMLDPHMGFAMGGRTQEMADDFFHNQYQGIGDWLFKDLDWNGDIPW